ncbi:DUF1189 domain-containing protein [Bacillus piscicola]|uniref:DUF1189 domain-containing protein n=1 Tax=Bacillus piscicola TaxID=1632684 RepID=UPI001F09F0D8|nr:DUF1189 domain-containing protein [Bacillus piscicola]
MNLIQTFIKSLYSSVYIGRFRFHGIGKTIGYVFFLMLLASIPSSILLTNTILSVTDRIDDAFTDEIPDFTLEDGVLHSNQDTPLINKENAETIIFDSTGEMKESDIDNTSDTLALLREKIIIIDNGNKNTFRYEQAGDLQLTKEDIVSMMSTIESLLPIFIPVFLLILYLFSTALKFVGITALSLFGLLIRNVAPLSLSYRHIWMLCAYTVTLPTILLSLAELLPFPLPGGFIIYWALAFIMLYQVYRHLPKPRKKATT